MKVEEDSSRRVIFALLHPPVLVRFGRGLVDVVHVVARRGMVRRLVAGAVQNHLLKLVSRVRVETALIVLLIAE